MGRIRRPGFRWAVINNGGKKENTQSEKIISNSICHKCGKPTNYKLVNTRLQTKTNICYNCLKQATESVGFKAMDRLFEIEIENETHHFKINDIISNKKESDCANDTEIKEIKTKEKSALAGGIILLLMATGFILVGVLSEIFAVIPVAIVFFMFSFLLFYQAVKYSDESEKRSEISKTKITEHIHLHKDLIISLTEKYQSAVEKFIDSLEFNPFSILWDNSLNEYKMDIRVFMPYFSYCKLAKEMFYYDGIFDIQFNNTHTNIDQEFVYFKKGLISRIEKEIQDKDNLDLYVWLIIRNAGIIQMAKIYESEIGYETLNDFCKESERANKGMFACYKIKKKDIFTPIVPFCKNLFPQIEHFISTLKSEKESEKFFNNNKICDYENMEEIDDIDNIDDIDCLDGYQFEEFICKLFEKRGYNAETTPKSGDYGIDVIIRNNLISIGIQCKLYLTQKVDSSAVQEAVTAIKHYNLDKAMVITNNYFQPSAITLAKENNVLLWDRNRLEKEIEKYL